MTMSAKTLVLLALVLLNCSVGFCFWLPSYRVNLNQQEEFVFLSGFSDGEEEEAQEMEMVKDDQLRGLRVAKGKMKMLDDHLKRSFKPTPRSKKEEHISNKVANDYFDELGMNQSLKRDLNPLEPVPASTRLLINGVEKRTSPNDTTTNDTTANDTDANYDYESFKAEYETEVKVAVKDSNTFSYKEEDNMAERTLKDGVKYFFDFKRPRNCTREEALHFGIKAMKCVVHDFEEASSNKERLSVGWKMWRIARFWIIIYTIVTVPLYCKYGFCCCCCCCSLCSPRQVIHEAKRYAAINPPGVIVKEDGKVHTYQATEYETEAYEYLMQYARNM